MIYPAPLMTGDSVAVTAVASVVSEEVIEPGIEVLERWGLTVHRGEHLYDRVGSFAGTDADRLSDLQQALDDPDIRAIFMARGGYGTTRVMDQLDLTGLKAHPKWVVGFSDVTALHACLVKDGFITLHGPMPGYYARESAKQSTDYLRQMLFGSWTSAQPSREIQGDDRRGKPGYRVSFDGDGHRDRHQRKDIVFRRYR